MGLENYFKIIFKKTAETCYARLNLYFSDLRSLLPRRDTYKHSVNMPWFLIMYFNIQPLSIVLMVALLEHFNL